jgi:choline-sulfatase
MPPPSRRRWPSLASPLLALVLVATALGCGGLQAPPRPPEPPPNLLLLVIDCLRGDELSVAGYARATTPNLDAIAKQGVRFQQVSSQASWTRPSLPSILTGLYPSEHGLLDLLDDNSDAPAAALADSVVTLGERLHGAGYATAMFGEQQQLAPRFGLSQGFDVWQPKSSSAGNIQKKLLEWSATGTGGKPFFAYLHYLEIHFPYCPPKELRGHFDEGSSALNPCADWRKLRDDMRTGAFVPTAADRQLLRARYDEELFALDAAIGGMVAELQRRGTWDRTLVVVTADHGEEFGEHGGYFHGQSLYEELLHVPLIVKPPASWTGPRGVTIPGLVEQRNLAATFLDAAGVKDPPRGTRSLLPWVRGEKVDGPPSPFTISESAEQVAVRTPRWKLIARKPGKTLPAGHPSASREIEGLELYDLQSDPGETKNVANESRRELAAMKQILAGWRSSLVATDQHTVEMDAETREGLKALGYLK